MARRLEDWIADALHEIVYLRQLLAAHPRLALLEDETLNSATVYSLLKLTEACRHLPDAFTEPHKEIPWRAMAAFADITNYNGAARGRPERVLLE
jgi:uncharacterized protein with HEPN domain